MNIHVDNAFAALSHDKPLSIAILAMGGQGGGVLADWIVELAESQGWVAQTTSVPGVAQRTGATIYYLELLKAREGAAPVLALMPTPGDVDIVLAAELMEAGRSVLRGLVTPDKTMLIASTHRSFAVGEKEKPGNGIGDPTVVVDATDFAAKKTIAFDMDTLATKNGSVISSSMFGALAASGALPFAKEAFEATVRHGGKGVDASLRAFNAAYDRVLRGGNDTVSAEPGKTFAAIPQSAGYPALDGLIARIRQEFPERVQPMLYAGVKKLTDFQDPTYADEYLTEVGKLHAADAAHGGAEKDFAFTAQGAKYVAVAMAYDDVIRVADLKTRGSRFDRVKKEVGIKGDQILYTTEYMHPRMEEVCGTLPRSLGRFIESRPALFNWLNRRIDKGRRVKTGTLFWFAGLYLVSSLRRFRRGNLRHAVETEHRRAWIASALEVLALNYDLAVEVLGNRRLVKGYSDTHVRGLSKFDRVMSALPMLAGREDGAAWMRRLRQAALLDEGGVALDGALKTVATL
ncbi:indolepyruvate oxidoreductase subunit beta family protein [Rhizobium sp. SL86]|uniref:indolepyruvate oxidoreductase subunit beta family protein n=1 Tax=Rhizobium sp. SL86 TaxID=2995148 RepID=UPI00227636CD|nr:indolepyruvate oxidoreductase subunit beta family protein [Rhizobium sp. SL86]MCY1667418.1 indolepyruvate oxidoreductase subunit beta family protein [Rhizobium sp. SL86]